MAAVMALAMFGTGCGYYSSFGFPVEAGNVETGRQVFVDFRCHQCHTVAGVRLPEINGAASPRLELGGETSRIKAYSELVTSVINPDHRISERYRNMLPQSAASSLTTPMPMTHIETMTVRQLIDLVAFLDSRYVLIDDYEYDFVDEYQQVPR
jgi:mono/diheme cytochrome c family protein